MKVDPVEVILKDVAKWGKHQILTYISLGLVYGFSILPLGYVFIARDVKYRCLIPQCENASDTSYNPDWLKGFLPFKGGHPDSCRRFAVMSNSCTTVSVLRNETFTCDQFVYQTKDVTIVHDFGIHCDENIWQLTLVGTISMCGELVCLAYSGFISDRYGRKTLIIISILCSTVAGILKSLSVSYTMYVIMEFLDTFLGAGMYNAAFILAMEFVAPSNRNLANILICCLFATGEIILGIAAWLTPTWRIMLRTLYIPGIISLVFFWTIPESIRWLLSKNKIKEIQIIVSRLQHNEDGTENQALLKYLKTYNENQRSLPNHQSPARTENFTDAIKFRILLLRLIHCSFTWICCTFLYYGLTMNSVAISESIYLSFIFSAAVEIPGYFIYYYLNSKIGRRWMTSISFILAGIACLAVGFIPKSLQWLELTLYLVGKCCATVTYTVIYVYTTEMFPTSSRHAMLSVCAMMGRLGAMVAPQIPLLARVWETLPLLLFAIMGTICGSLALLFPETLNTKLPDTIQEAINIGKKPKETIQHDTTPHDDLKSL